MRNVLAQQTFVFQYGCADRFTGGAGGKDEPTGSGGGDESNHSNPERRRVSETVCYGAGNVATSTVNRVRGKGKGDEAGKLGLAPRTRWNTSVSAQRR